MFPDPAALRDVPNANVGAAGRIQGDVGGDALDLHLWPPFDDLELVALYPETLRQGVLPCGLVGPPAAASPPNCDITVANCAGQPVAPHGIMVLVAPLSCGP